jgi:predicted negative regulator of RcsB-dependent stress response
MRFRARVLAKMGLRTGGLALLVLSLGCCESSAAGKELPSAVQDLQYGEVLYHYYQQDYFLSIVHLQIAQIQERLPHHAEEAELLLGGLDLSYGLRNAADRIFQRLLTDTSRSEEVRNRAWYSLARVSYQRGDAARALQALESISGKMMAATRDDVTLLHSLILLQLGRNDEAIEVLQHSHNSRYWSPYLAYNLGVAQIRGNQLEEGAGQLERVAELKGSNEELQLLRDKANLSLGYSYLQHDESDRSRQFLKRVRLSGPLTSKALLGAGWADAEVQAYGRALLPWYELSQGSVTDPAVQEVLLAIPYALARMDLHGRAVQQYEQAITTLLTEKDQLGESIQAIRAGELLPALQGEALGSGNGWQQPLAVITGSPALRYQVELMASHEFQEAVKNYRDLEVLQDNLDQWAMNIDAYDDMLDAREVRFATQQPAAVQALQGDALGGLQQRHTRLADTLARIERNDDPVGLAHVDAARQWQRLVAIEDRLNELPDTEQLTALRDRQRLLKGTLYWRLNAEFKSRLWKMKQQLAELDDLLEQGRHARDILQQADLGATENFADFGRRITRHKADIERLQARTVQTRVAQGNQIERLAVGELEQQKERIETYLIQARFALAQTYDSALHPAVAAGSGGRQ